MTRFIAFIIVAAFISPVVAQTDTTFTYQGQLKENGGIANGPFDMDFSLWDAESAGNQIGETSFSDGVQVVEGKFAVELDFAADAFDNSNRWLEISVNGDGLNPRTPITRSPYSIQTRGIFVDQDKNVGIGNSAPDGSLHVQDGSAGNVTAYPDSVAVLESDGFGYLSILTPYEFERGIFFGGPEGNISGGITYNNPALPSGLQFRTGGNQNRMVITQFGRVGIGTTTPSTTLDVAGNVKANLIEIPHDTDHSTISSLSGDELLVANWAAGEIRFANNTVPNNLVSTRLMIKNDGKIGIGTNEPEFRLHVDGSAGKPGGGSWSSASDIRLKKNVQPLDDALGKLLRLRGVTFQYIDPDAIHELPGQRIGMIAQEVEKIVPDWVDVRDDGYKTVTHRGFEALTVEAMRQLREETNTVVESLRSENVALCAENVVLRAENDAIGARLDSLESLVEQLAQKREEQTK